MRAMMLGLLLLGFLIVVGSYLAAEYLRVWRPRRGGQQAAVAAQAPPERAADLPTGSKRPGRPHQVSLGQG